MTIARLQKAADLLDKSNIGYDQSNRWSFLDRKNRTVKAGGECDCSSGCGAIAYLAGYPVDLTGTFWTGNFAAKMRATGLFDVIRYKHRNQVRAGDFVVGPGHVIFARTATKWWSAEADERGMSRGGKAGDQTGRETRYRAPYDRSRGWAYIVRLVTPATLQRRILAAYKARKPGAVEDALKLLAYRAPWDGPRWRWFLTRWATLDAGMSLCYDPADLGGLEDGHHAFVVLGSALTKDGTLTEKMRRRLTLAKLALDVSPASVVIVTGGAPRNGITEAAAGKAWLVAAGIDPARIILETKAGSTIGNALNTIPILAKRGVTSYTLVSDASHLRRASVLFLAAQLAIETSRNQLLNLEPRVPLAFNDYAPGAVLPEQPVRNNTLATIADEARALLKL